MKERSKRILVIIFSVLAVLMTPKMGGHGKGYNAPYPTGEEMELRAKILASKNFAATGSKIRESPKISEETLILEPFLKVHVPKPRFGVEEEPGPYHYRFYWLVGFRELIEHYPPPNGVTRFEVSPDAYIGVYDEYGNLTDWIETLRLENVWVGYVNGDEPFSWFVPIILLTYDWHTEVATITNDGRIRVILRASSYDRYGGCGSVALMDLDRDELPEVVVGVSTARWVQVGDVSIESELMFRLAGKRGALAFWLDYPDLSVSHIGVVSWDIAMRHLF